MDETVEVVESAGSYTTVSNFDDYYFQGHSLKDLCLYYYCSLVYKKKRLSNGIPYDIQHPQVTTHYQFLRSDGVIPTLLGKILFVRSNESDPNTKEQYFCILVELFVP